MTGFRSNIESLTQRYSGLSMLERMTSPQFSPRYSVTSLLLIKIRILAEFIVKFFLDLRLDRKLLRRTKQLMGSEPFRDALLVANGPSALNLSFQTVRRQQESGELSLIFVNDFVDYSNMYSLIPNYLVLSDPLHKPNSNMGNNSKLWKLIFEHRQITLIIPTDWHRDIPIGLPNQIIYFNDKSLQGWSNNISPTRPRGYISMTSYKALAMAIHLGFSKIFLIGLDNTMYLGIEVDEQNHLTEFRNHHTSNEEIPSVYTKKYPRGVGDYFYDTSNLFLDLRLFSKPHIYNLNQKGLVDVFTKISSTLVRE
jgi:hypothetical protein